MKYELGRLGPDNFEHMIQSLVQGIAGLSTSVFGAGPDGQREAVIEGGEFSINGNSPTHGRTVVQAKYKSPETKKEDWAWLRTNLKKELDGFRNKATTHPAQLPETYLFFTNIVLTPKLESGIYDKAKSFVMGYQDIIPDIRFFGADDIRTMLENNREVARCYLGFLMPGDVLEEMQNALTAIGNNKFENLIEYARQMFREDGAVRLEQAGSVSSRTINLRNIYTDLEAKAQNTTGQVIPQLAKYVISQGNRLQKRVPAEGNVAGEEFPNRPGKAPEYNMVFIGNAGQGKSTLCQYICQLYRAALLQRFRHNEPDVSCYLTGEDTSEVIVPRCERFPVQINLRLFAAWINKQRAEDNCSVLSYILALINGKAHAQLTILDLRYLLSAYPWVFFFDGLDEVPASSNRSEVLRQIQIFLEKDLIESTCDSLVICTSRPQGYDAAFSQERYRHYELQDMSKSLCEQYIDKLLRYLEDNSDERTRYREILLNALNDPMVSKLMSTPLYTAIIVLLVKMGGSPPTKRYALFQDYCAIVIRREQQKETLPELNDSFDWIIDLHAQLGFLLQTESERAENAAAELSATRCKSIIANLLKYESYDGEIQLKAEEFYKAITKRLSFLAEVSGANQEESVVFPLRSIQEYFAAEWLITFNDENKLSTALELISVSAYWRNVYLFTAGYFAKHRERKNINETLFRICQRNNGDENYYWSDTEVSQVTLQGSWLALDMLCDNLFNHPNEQQRYLRVAARLIETDYDGIDLQKKLLQLPDKIAETFLREWIIPHFMKTKTVSKCLLVFLWVMASRRNSFACTELENICSLISHPPIDAIYSILEYGTEHIGGRMIDILYRWITEGSFFDIIYPINIRRNYEAFLVEYYTHYDQEALSQEVLRQITYQFLLDGIQKRTNSVPKELLCRSTLLQKLSTDSELQSNLNAVRRSGKGIILRSITGYKDNPCLAQYVDEFRSAQLPELAALMAFCYAPSYAGLVSLLEAYRDLPEYCKSAFSMLLKRFNWLLKELAMLLEEGESSEDLIKRYDSFTIDAFMEKDEHYMLMAKNQDYISITHENSWHRYVYFFGCFPDVNVGPILEAAEKVGINESFLSFLYYSTGATEKWSPELSDFCMRHFNLLFQFSHGVNLAFKAFASVPMSFLVSENLCYPTNFQDAWLVLYPKDSFLPKIIERINILIDIGGHHLQAFSLLAFLFPYLQDKSLLWHTAEKAASLYADIKSTGNQAALLGCVLCMLILPITEEQNANIRDCMVSIVKNPSVYRTWYDAISLASLNGQLLLREMLFQPPVSEDDLDLICRYTFSIRQKLEGRPIERKTMTELAESAHNGLSDI